MTIISDRFNPVATQAAPPLVSVDLPGPVALALAGSRPVRQVSLADLTRTCHEMQETAVVACPLFWGGSDALCVIDALHRAGFCGTLVIAAPPLPDPGMVEREVRSAAGGLSLRFVTV